MFNIMNPSLVFSPFISLSPVSHICGGLVVGWNMLVENSDIKESSTLAVGPENSALLCQVLLLS